MSRQALLARLVRRRGNVNVGGIVSFAVEHRLDHRVRPYLQGPALAGRHLVETYVIGLVIALVGDGKTPQPKIQECDLSHEGEVLARIGQHVNFASNVAAATSIEADRDKR